MSTTSANPGPCRSPKRACRPFSPPTATTPTTGPRPSCRAASSTRSRATTSPTWSISAKGIVDPFEFAAFERLCQNLGVDSAVATLIASGLRDALAPAGSGTGNAPLLPESVAQLSWLGVDAASLELLAPYIVILPGTTPVNVNTASAEVLVAVIPGNDHATAERLLQVRQRTPFEDMTRFWAQVPALAPQAGATTPPAKLSVNSAFFEVRGRLRLSDRVLEESSLVQRVQGRQVDVLRRERVASREDSPPAN